MAAARPLPVVPHGSTPSRTDPALLSASHVFLRIDAVKRPLVPPYEGPFPVVRRSSDSKTFVILRREKEITVSIDRLKPANLLPDASAGPSVPVAVPAAVPGPRPRPIDVPVPPVVTSSGRVSRPVSLFQA